MEQVQIDIIRTAFENMQTREDFLHLLNEVKPLVYGENTVPFDLKQLTWYSNPKLGRKRYTEFKIKKKSGTERSIHAPVKGLKALQKTLGLIFQCIYEPHNAAMGFVRNKSIVDNAKVHAGKIYVYNIDLKDFFSSVDQARVWKCLQLKPFNLNNTTSFKHQYIKWDDFKEKFLKKDEVVTFLKGEGHIYAKTSYATIFVSENLDHQKNMYIRKGSSFLKNKEGKSLKDTHWLVNHIPNTNRQDICNIIASLCCTEMQVERKNSADEWELVKRNVLPQGAPTSPVLTNIICQRLDFILTGVAKRFHLNYSRYADDITFSSMHNVYQPDGEFLIELHRVIAEQGFHIKESKTRLQKEGYRKEVTGLLVNEKANVQQRYIKQLRMWLYYWERYGSERANSFFLQQYMFDKKNIIKGKPDMINVIGGKLDYLKMVKGADNELYLKLKERYDDLTDKPGIKNVLKNEKSDKVKTILRLIQIPENESHISINKTEKQFEKIQEKELNETSVSSRMTENQKQTIPIIHNPILLVKLLDKFSENKHPLKFAKHSWDYGKIEDLFENYFEFIKALDSKGSNVGYQILGIKKELGQKILNFINNENEGGYYISKNGEKKKFAWGEFRIPLGWKSKELSNWAFENPTKDPFDYPINSPIPIEKYGKVKRLSYFRDIVDVFAHEIEIRPEDNQLEAIMVTMRKKYLKFDFRKPNYINLKGKQFYTDVNYFERALNKIFYAISKRTMFPQIDISAINELDRGYTIIEILQYDSYCSDKSSYEMIKEIENGDFADIKNYLENLCDWSIESKFSDGPYRLNYLASTDDIQSKEPLIITPLGFKHIFKFYKS